MAAVVNSAQKILLAAPTRTTNLVSADILLDVSTNAFHVNAAGANDPASITAVAGLIDLEGTISFSCTGGTLTDVTATTAALTYANKSAPTAAITASVTVNGQTYTKTRHITTVRDGLNGDAGMSVATVQIFQRSASATPLALPSATTTLTFASGVLAGLNNGWSQNLPAADPVKPYLQSSLASARGAGTTDSIAANEWAGVVVLTQDGQTGAAGLNSATVRICQRTASATAPALPSVAATYTFATGALAGINNGWSVTMPAVSAGAFLHTSHATAAATTATDAIANTEWAASQLLYDAAAVIAAQAAADAANEAIAAISSDNVLSKGEKAQANREWQVIYDERGGVVTQASSLGVDSTDYTNKFNTLQAYLVAMGSFSDYTSDTTIVGSTFRDNFANYYTAKQALLNAIAAKAANASADLALIGRGCNVAGTTATKSAQTLAWDSDAYGTQLFGGGVYASARVTGIAYLAFGLNNDPVTDAGYTNITLSIMTTTDSTLLLLLNGEQLAQSTYAAGDELTITYDRVNARWYRGGTLLFTYPIALGGSHGFDSSFYSPGATLTNIRCGPYQSALFADIGGTGKPADNATVGAPAGTPVAGTAAETIAQTVNDINSPFSISLSGTLSNAVAAGGPRTYGTLTATLTGGIGTVDVLWEISAAVSDNGSAASAALQVTGNNLSRGVAGTAANGVTIFFTVKVTATDSKRRNVSATHGHSASHGTIA